MTKGRAKNLDDDAIGLIVGVLDGWSGKLTWDLLIDAVEKRLRVRYTRQALDKRARIKIAYQVTKARISKINTSKSRQKLSAVELVAFMQRTNRLEAENIRLRTENEKLLEQFVTWAYNAYLKGLTKEYLNTPLSRVDRETTKMHLREPENR
ncbi:hypothetical protein PVE_R2G0866 [Pseudomonas veronii 1YdBTEX2]|uniref:Uncharacterized protein n=1 Tax=Pseudomonas veronii 1YdBTEX2 TaxID=1295141 RepID=A0A1D3K9M1_PSEVE|nr:hypothetical protein [Pseudomonas veronii]SBW83260.1 hypothetical protein PVE_R1G5380 [Pseudomonas veronii 1YdBTEX2]SBW84891.1 hypothetical protein PVE_R2G0866 [Pseudomonas veronii 1YdBTEX2]